MSQRAGRGIDVKVEGRADLSKLAAEFEKAKRRAAELGQQIQGIEGNLTRLDRLKLQLGDMLGGSGRQGLGQLGSLIGGTFGAGAMFQQVQGGLERYKDQLIQLDNEGRAVKALGQSYRELQEQLNATGQAYGYQTREVTALFSALGSTYGRAGAGRVMDELQLIQGFSRGYGMSAMEGGSIFTRAAQQGITTEGGDMHPRQFAALIADAVAVGDMAGREGEVVDAIQGLSQQMNSRLVGVQGTQLGASALATLNATGVRGLQGGQGAALLGQLNQAVMHPGGGEAGNLFMYQALTGGQGGMGVADYEYLREQGLAGQGPTGKSNLQAVMEAIQQMPVAGRYRLMAARELTGLSMHQYEALEQAFMRDGKFDTAKLGGLQERLGPEGLKSVDASVWGLLAELQKGGDASAIGREFAQLSGQQPVAGRDALFEQIAQYGRSNVALSEGQALEKLDADLAKAAEAAGAKLLPLATAAKLATERLLELSKLAPGPLGGIAPMVAGAAAGQLGGWAMGQAGGALGRLLGWGGAAGGAATAGAPAAAAAAPGAAAALAPAAGVLAMGAAGAYGGSQFAESALGLPGLGSERQMNAMGAGWDRLWGGGDRHLLGDAGQALGGIVSSLWSVPIGLGGGVGHALQGGDFREGYFRTFDQVNPFADFSGRRPGNALPGLANLSPSPNLLLTGQAGTLLNRPGVPPLVPSSRGGWWDVPEDDQPALLHRREMVLPAALAELLREALTRPAAGAGDAPGGLDRSLRPDQLREAASELRIRIEPIQVRMPDGSTQQVPAQATAANPFAGIIDQPIRTTGGSS